jgi:hypothetical protein
LPPKIVVEANGSYNFEEVDTGKTWINSEPIYRKCYSGSYTPTGAATGNESEPVDTFVDTVINIIAYGGYVTVGDNMNKKAVPYMGGNLANNTFNFYSVFYQSSDSKLYFVHKDNGADSYTHSFTIWVEYTKDTH